MTARALRNTPVFLAFRLVAVASLVLAPVACGLDQGGDGDPPSTSGSGTPPSRGSDSVGASDIGGTGSLPGLPMDSGGGGADAAPPLDAAPDTGTDAAKPPPKGPGKGDDKIAT